MFLFISFTLPQVDLSEPERKEPQDVIVARQETVREGPYLRTRRAALMELSTRSRWALVQQIIGLGISVPLTRHQWVLFLFIFCS